MGINSFVSVRGVCVAENSGNRLIKNRELLPAIIDNKIIPIAAR